MSECQEPRFLRSGVPSPTGSVGKAAAFQSSQRLGQGLCSGP
jgi:hypothetical protein